MSLALLRSNTCSFCVYQYTQSDSLLDDFHCQRKMEMSTSGQVGNVPLAAGASALGQVVARAFLHSCGAPRHSAASGRGQVGADGAVAQRGHLQVALTDHPLTVAPARCVRLCFAPFWRLALGLVGFAAMRTRVKICGVTTPGDAALAERAGADAVGLNFHPPSPRAVDLDRAEEIVATVSPFVAVVAVVVNPGAELVERLLRRVRVDCLQFHGEEEAGFCRSFGVPYVKAAGVDATFDFGALQRAHPDAAGFLLDAHDPKRRGGTGETFDWSRWPASDRPLLLAGGLTPCNVGGAIAVTRPFGVDVASGVEGPVKGRKDAQRIEAFMAAVAASLPDVGAHQRMSRKP